MKKLISSMLALVLFILIVGCDFVKESESSNIAQNIATSKIAGIKMEIIPIDKFTTIEQMIAKAKAYKTLDDVYKSSGYDPKVGYYLNFSKEKLTMIFKDKKIIVPKIPNDYEFSNGGLHPDGYYFFDFSYPKGRFELLVYTYKIPSKLKKHQKPIYNINGIEVYEGDGYCYFWLYENYYINVKPTYKMSKDEMKELIDNLNLTVVAI